MGYMVHAYFNPDEQSAVESWCSRSRIQLLGTGDKWRRGSSLQISEFSVPLTGQHLHLRLAELQTYPGTRCARVSIEQLHVHIQMCSAQEVHSCRRCWFQAKDGVLGRGDAPTQTLAAPLGGGGQAAMHWAACCPPAGAQVTGESNHLHMLSGRARVQEGLWARGWSRACADAWRRCTRVCC